MIKDYKQQIMIYDFTKIKSKNTKKKMRELVKLVNKSIIERAQSLNQNRSLTKIPVFDSGRGAGEQEEYEQAGCTTLFNQTKKKKTKF